MSFVGILDEGSDAAPNRSDRQNAPVPWGKRAAGVAYGRATPAPFSL